MKLRRRLLAGACAAAMLFGMSCELPAEVFSGGAVISSYADDDIISGKCGENVTYSFDPFTGTLTISGSGEMENYEVNDTAPWANFKVQKSYY
ncbi:hypothetical protein SAMN02910317_01575 [Ruminococcaceae bacterium FB2012]|nr:hypothetical protein SAMN02910317_01575 [Ruminococcaceae bacterium FB2012]